MLMTFSDVDSWKNVIKFQGDIDVCDLCWRQNVLVTDLRDWKNHQDNEKRRQDNDFVTNIFNRSS